MINELKLNLACGQRKIEGYFGIDIIPGKDVDSVIDLQQYPWPIESDSADEIICSHYVEHIPMDSLSIEILKLLVSFKDASDLRSKAKELLENLPSDALIRFMDEIYRIVKPGGKVKIIAPYWSSIRAWQDPTHRRAINEATFLYFNKDWRTANLLDHYNIKSDFDFTYGYDIAQQWVVRNDETRTAAIRDYTNSVNDVHVTLTKKEYNKKD